jgi:hypothetical protein
MSTPGFGLRVVFAAIFPGLQNPKPEVREVSVAPEV